MSRYYWALFQENEEIIEVKFPDYPGCVTWGHTWEEAVDLAHDALEQWIKNADEEFIVAPSSYEELRELKEIDDLDDLIPINYPYNKDK